MLKRMLIHTAVFTVLLATGALAFNAQGWSGGGLARMDGWGMDGGRDHDRDRDFGKREWDG